MGEAFLLSFWDQLLDLFLGHFAAFFSVTRPPIRSLLSDFEPDQVTFIFELHQLVLLLQSESHLLRQSAHPCVIQAILELIFIVQLVAQWLFQQHLYLPLPLTYLVPNYLQVIRIFEVHLKQCHFTKQRPTYSLVKHLLLLRVISSCLISLEIRLHFRLQQQCLLKSRFNLVLLSHQIDRQRPCLFNKLIKLFKRDLL